MLRCGLGTVQTALTTLSWDQGKGVHGKEEKDEFLSYEIKEESALLNSRALFKVNSTYVFFYRLNKRMLLKLTF